MGDGKKVPSFISTDKETNSLLISPIDAEHIGEYDLEVVTYYSKTDKFENSVKIKVTQGNLPYMTEDPKD